MSLDPENGIIRLNEQLQREIDELSRRTGEAPLALLEKALGLLKIELDSKKRNSNEQGGDGGIAVDQCWEQAGLLGCAKGLPPDLSTNPEHMKGFGGG